MSRIHLMVTFGLVLFSTLLGCNSGTSGKTTTVPVKKTTKGVYVSNCQNASILGGEKTFTLTVASSDTVEADGVICSGSLDVFNNMFLDYPGIKYINITKIDGSIDDVINLKLSTKVHANGLVTRLASNSSVASGGTDFFLAGNLRKIAEGAKIGVHNWTDGSGKKGKDYPKNSSEHQKYLDYYAKVGISADFYWFTLNAKPNGNETTDGDMHWMTKEEMNQYGLAI